MHQNSITYQNGTAKKSIFLAKAQGLQHTETGMYVLLYEDFEYCATHRFNKKMILK